MKLILVFLKELYGDQSGEFLMLGLKGEVVMNGKI